MARRAFRRCRVDDQLLELMTASATFVFVNGHRRNGSTSSDAKVIRIAGATSGSVRAGFRSGAPANVPERARSNLSSIITSMADSNKDIATLSEFSSQLLRCRSGFEDGSRLRGHTVQVDLRPQLLFRTERCAPCLCESGRPRIAASSSRAGFSRRVASSALFASSLHPHEAALGSSNHPPETR